jgi:antitoxin (DNA-binding transcriptional repressor) of toxin-antitoxin stability system
MSDIMSNMGSTTITVRELQQHLKRVLATVARGHTLQVTRRRRLVAVLGPPRGTTAAAWPDLEARARSVLGSRVVVPSASDTVIADRGER